MYSAHLNLLMTSPVLLMPQVDWPKNTYLTGFSWFEPDFMKGEVKSMALARFLAAGSPPVIFAPGGSTRTNPGQFFTESIKACKRLGVRAILLAAQRFHAQLPRSPDVLVMGYLPYSELLKHASAMVHSGGIGAIGWSLRFAMPSLLVPSSWDQYDNAHRMRRLAGILNQQDYTSVKIASALKKIWADQQQHQLLKSHAEIMMNEDGAVVACAKIEALLSTFGNPA